MYSLELIGHFYCFRNKMDMALLTEGGCRARSSAINIALPRSAATG